MDFALQGLKSVSTTASTFFTHLGDNSNNKTTLNAEGLHTVFRAVYYLGPDTVAELCQQKLDGKTENEILQSINAAPVCDGNEVSKSTMYWLHELNIDDVAHVLTIVLNLKSQIAEGIRFHKIDGREDQKIIFGKIGDLTIYIEKGRICCSAWPDFVVTKLVEPHHFLSLDKKNLNELNLTGQNMPGVELSEANLVGSNLVRAKVVGANLCQANLSKASLSQADLSGADLRGANFENAELINVTISGAKIDQDTNFSNATFTLNLIDGKWSPEDLQHYFNHLDPENSVCYLRFIDQINDACLNREGVPQKVDLMHQIIASFGDCDISCIHAALKDTLLNNPIYIQNKIIAQFINDKLIINEIASKNEEPLALNSNMDSDDCQTIEPSGDCAIPCNGPSLTDDLPKNSVDAKDERIAQFSNDKLTVKKIAPEDKKLLDPNFNMEFRNLLSNIMQKNIGDRQKFMIDENTYFIRVIATCIAPGKDKQLIADAKKLYKEYFSLNGVSRFLKDVPNGSKLLQSANGIANDHRALLLYKIDDETKKPVVALVSRNQLNRMSDLSGLVYKSTIDQTKK